MSENSNKASILHFVDRTKDDPFFVGHQLRLFAQARGFSDALTADFLECDQESLDRLCMCRCPDELSDSYEHDVEKVAEYASCSASKLRVLIREARGISVLAKTREPTSEAALLAARDRKEDEQHSESDGGEEGGDGS